MKKKHFIGLSTLLLVLLLGLFTTSYALTENGFKNLMYNYAVNHMEYTDSQAKTLVQTCYTSFNGYYNYMTDNYLWFVCQRDTSYLGFWVQPASQYAINRTTKTRMSISGSKKQFTPISSSGIYFQIYPSSGYFITRTGSSMDRVNITTDIYYSEQDIYNTEYNPSLLYQAPYYSPSWFNSNGTYDINFSYVYNPVFQNVTVQDLLAQDVQMKAITYSDVYYDNDYLCVFGDFDQLDHVYLAYYKYNRYSGQWEPYQWVSPYTNYEKEDNQIRLYFNGNYVANTIICLGFIPKTDDFYAQYAWFYLTGKNTSTSSGVVVPTSYSGDNDVQQQINDNNLQEIKDTLTDDSQVDNILGEFVSGDASDIAEKFGFSILNRYYYDFIHDTIVDIVEVLEDDGDVYFDYSMHGEAPTRIYASDFTTPDGPLKTFLSMFLISCTVFAFYKYIADLIELISTGNILEALQEFKVDRNIFKM